jgi:hypothetical protein
MHMKIALDVTGNVSSGEMGRILGGGFEPLLGKNILYRMFNQFF